MKGNASGSLLLLGDPPIRRPTNQETHQSEVPPLPSLFREGGRLQIFGKSIAYSKNIRKFAAEKEKGDTTMATAIKAIPTLKGKEAREFLHRAEEVERDFKGDKNKDQHPLCRMAHEILSKAGML